jgi:competence ComEA-like helix-hairpin-helix protein
MFRVGNRSHSIIAALAILLLAATSVSAQKKQPPSTPVDINVANIKELEQLPGVGATTAKAIIDFRTKSGRFHRVEDLLVIRGISETKLKKMRPYITVGSPPAAPPTRKPLPPATHTPASASSTKPQPNASPSPH